MATFMEEQTRGREDSRAGPNPIQTNLLARAEANDAVHVGQGNGALGAVRGNHNFHLPVLGGHERGHDFLLRQLRVEGYHLLKRDIEGVGNIFCLYMVGMFFRQ